MELESYYVKLIKKARKKRNRLILRTQKEILKAYKKAHLEISKRLQENLKRGYETKYLEDTLDDLEDIQNDLRTDISNNIKDGIYKASNISIAFQEEWFEKIGLTNDFILNFSDRAKMKNYNFLRTLIEGGYYKDGKSLDERIWNITKKNSRDIEHIISTNIAKGINVKEIAQQVDKYVNPIARNSPKTMGVPINRDISYEAVRLARTSITHTVNETGLIQAKENPFCIGMKWNLSPSHYERQVKIWGPDECDDYANQNSYNLGRGVFPLDEYPVSHPNCLCFQTQEQLPMAEIINRVNKYVETGDESFLKVDTRADYSGIIEKGYYKNDYRTRKQFEKYKKAGVGVPESFTKFQGIKKKSDIEYWRIKNQYRSFNEIDKKTWNEEFKSKCKDTILRFSKEYNIDLNAHSVARYFDRIINKPNIYNLDEKGFVSLIKQDKNGEEIKTGNKFIYSKDKALLIIFDKNHDTQIKTIIERVKNIKKEWIMYD